MLRCSIVVDPFYHGNRLFRLDDPIANRDNCLVGFHELRNSLSNNGISLDTDDVVSVRDADVVIFNEMPSVEPSSEVLSKSVLILFECEVIRPINWDPVRISTFPIVMSWNDTLVDGSRVRKVNFPVDLNPTEPRVPWVERRLSTLIAGNKVASDPRELYSERRGAISWFEQNHPDEFDFYGPGWDSRVFRGLLRPLNRFRLARRAFVKQHPSYCGLSKVKRETLSGYRFSICFENAHSISGYITEKIVDSIAAGCIPVYWGAPNVSDHIPDDCFIDFRKFRNYEDLYSALSTMSEFEHSQIVARGRKFLAGPKGRAFGPDSFADRVTKGILDLIRDRMGQGIEIS